MSVGSILTLYLNPCDLKISTVPQISINSILADFQTFPTKFQTHVKPRQSSFTNTLLAQMLGAPECRNKPNLCATFIVYRKLVLQTLDSMILIILLFLLNFVTQILLLDKILWESSISVIIV